MISLEIGKIIISVPKELKELLNLNYINNLILLKKKHPQIAKLVQEEENDIENFTLLKQGENIFISFAIASTTIKLQIEKKENIFLTETEAKYLIDKRVVVSSLIPFNLLFKMAKTQSSEENDYLKHSFEFKVPIYIVEKYLDIFRVVLCLYDLSEVLNGSRLFIFFLGENGLKDFKSHLQNDQIELPNLTLSIPEVTYSTKTAEDINKILNEVWKEKDQELKNNYESICNYYDKVTLENWCEIFKNKKKLKILILTTKYSTFIKHSARDLKDGFSADNHHTVIAIEKEKDFISKLTPLYYVKKINKYKPELIIVVNHLRSEYPRIPTNVPFITWIQDNLPSLIDPKNIKKIGNFNIILGGNHLQKFGYPKENLYFIPAIVTNIKIYYPKQLSTSDLEKYGCDVSFVSNHSQTSYEEFLKLKEDVCAKIPNNLENEKKIISQFLDEFYKQFEDKYLSGKTLWGHFHYAEILRTLLEKFNISIDAYLKTNIVNRFYDEIGANFLMQQILKWLKKENINFKLYGKGWEKNKEFSRYGCGEAENGEELCKIFAASKINLNIDFYHFHWRLFDGFASGGFFLLNYSPFVEVNTQDYNLELSILKQINKSYSVNEICNKFKNKVFAEMLRSNFYIFYHKTQYDIITLEEIKHILYFFENLQKESSQYLNYLNFISYKNLKHIYYKNKKEFTEKIKYYLANEKERKSIVKICNEFIQDYNYEKFCDNILNITEAHFNKLQNT